MTEEQERPDEISDALLERWLQQARPVPRPERQASFLADLEQALTDTPQFTQPLSPRFWRRAAPWSLLAAACAVLLLALPVLRTAPELARESQPVQDPMQLGAAPPAAARKAEPASPAADSALSDETLQGPLQDQLADITGLEWEAQTDAVWLVRVPLDQQIRFEQRLAAGSVPYRAELLPEAASRATPSGRQSSAARVYRLSPLPPR